MSRNSIFAIVVIILLTVGGGLSYSAERSNNNKKAAEHAAKMKQEEAKMVKTGEVMAAHGSFTDYDTAKLMNAEKGQVVLFFSASWCPICQEANKNFNSTTPPEGLTLLKVDYDKSNDLKKKYGVTYQHTYVQVDKDGNLIKKWSGSTSYDQIKTQLN